MVHDRMHQTAAGEVWKDVKYAKTESYMTAVVLVVVWPS